MIRIAYIISHLKQGGPVNVLYNIIKGLDRNKFEPIIFTLTKEKEDHTREEDFKQLDVQIIYHQFSFYQLELSSKKIAGILESEMKALNIHLIHTHCYHPVLISSYIQRIPKIETLHNLSQEDFVMKKGLIVGNYMHGRYIYHLKKFQQGVAISETVKKYYSSKIKIPVRRIYNGIDLKEFSIQDRNSKKHYREKLNLPLHARIFIVIGTLSIRKNPLLIANAFSSLNKDKKDCYLLFLGEGALKEELEKISDSTPNILLIGFNKQVGEYLAAADFFISASNSEGFGLSYVEAIVSGLPAIGSSIPPFKELVEGVPSLEKLIFEKNNKEDLKEKMRFCLENKMDISQESAHFRHVFSYQEMAGQYMELYSSLIDQ